MNVKPKTYVIMGLFSPNDELTNLKEDVSAIKKQVAELLAEVQALRAAGHPADTQPATPATPEPSPQTSAPAEKPLLKRNQQTTLPLLKKSQTTPKP